MCVAEIVLASSLSHTLVLDAAACWPTSIVMQQLHPTLWKWIEGLIQLALFWKLSWECIEGQCIALAYPFASNIEERANHACSQIHGMIEYTVQFKWHGNVLHMRSRSLFWGFPPEGLATLTHVLCQPDGS
jgi:hypothetical protein